MSDRWHPVRPRNRPRDGRLPPESRKAQLLEVAMALAEQHGFDRLHRDLVAEVAGVSPALVSRYWTVPQLREQLVEAAVSLPNLTVLAQALVLRHPRAVDAPVSLRRAALAAAQAAQR